MSILTASIAYALDLGLKQATVALAPLGRFLVAIGVELQSRRDRRLLAAMDDQGLSDIGLCRGQIFDAVRGGRGTP